MCETEDKKVNGAHLVWLSRSDTTMPSSWPVRNSNSAALDFMNRYPGKLIPQEDGSWLYHHEMNKDLLAEGKGQTPLEAIMATGFEYTEKKGHGKSKKSRTYHLNLFKACQNDLGNPLPQHEREAKKLLGLVKKEKLVVVGYKTRKSYRSTTPKRLSKFWRVFKNHEIAIDRIATPSKALAAI